MVKLEEVSDADSEIYHDLFFCFRASFALSLPIELLHMSSSEYSKEKILLIEWILKQDKIHNLKLMTDLVLKLDQDSTEAIKIVGYRARAVPVTTLELLERIQNSLNEYKSNEFITLEKLEQESDQW